jgi:hypothetical protein
MAWLVWCHPGSERFELPDGFMGPVVVYFGHPRGTKSRRNWATLVYRIGKDGILFVKDPAPKGLSLVDWCYVSPDGKLTSIPSEDNVHPDFSIRSPRVRGVEHHGEWVQAQIGRPSDIDSFGENPHYLVSRIQADLGRIPPLDTTR